jgi:hypothetical protein
MAASKKSDIVDIPADELAEIVAAQEAPAPQREELAGGTIRETNTVYEDRTLSPEVDRVTEYEAEEVSLEGGSLLTTYGAPLGGWPKDKDAAGEAE